MTRNTPSRRYIPRLLRLVALVARIQWSAVNLEALMNLSPCTMFPNSSELAKAGLLSAHPSFSRSADVNLSSQDESKPVFRMPFSEQLPYASTAKILTF